MCRELGYQGAVRHHYAYNYYGPGSGPVWLSHLDCTGNETCLHYCSHGGITSGYYCDHYKEAGVVCKGNFYKEFLYVSKSLKLIL